MSSAVAPIVVLPLPDLESVIERVIRRVLGDGTPQPSTWLDTREVAALLGVHPRSVPQYVARGLPCKHLGPKTVRYERAAVEAWIAGR